MTEQELANKIITWLENLGYITYKEVNMYGRGGDARADIYFVLKKDGVIIDSIVVETKTSFSTKVIQQADRWRTSKLSHKVYVCVPSPKRKDYKNRLFLFKICKLLGIGVFQYYPTGIQENVVAEQIVPKNYPPLFEEQKDSIAGNDRSEYVTKFKLTINKIYQFMEGKDHYIWKDLITEIDHHYSNDKSAMSSLKPYVGDTSVIKGFKLDKIDKKICLIRL